MSLQTLENRKARVYPNMEMSEASQLKSKIVVLGSISMDFIARAPRLPKTGETVIAGSFVQMQGGKGANQAVACARLGAEVAIIGRVGADAFGDALLESLAADAIDTRPVARDDAAPTGVALIGVDETTGDNSIIVAPGANSRVSVADVKAAGARIEQADAVVCSLEVPMECVEAAAALSARHGVRFILNPSPVPSHPLSNVLLQAASVLVLNEHEAALLAPQRSSEETEYSSARRLLKQIAGSVVVTLGERGALAFEPNGPEVGRAMERARLKLPVIDTVGAGDCFTAGLAVGLAEGQRLTDAMRLATAAAGISVTRAGAQSSMPTRDEVEMLLQSG